MARGVGGVAFGCAALLSACAGSTGASGASPAPALTSAPAVHAAADEHVLIVNQKSPASPVGSDHRARQVEMLVRHFTPTTDRITEDRYVAGDLARYDRVVVVGNDPVGRWPDALMSDLSRGDRPILWIGYGLDQLPGDPDAVRGFAAGFALENPEGVRLAYRHQLIEVRLDELPEVRISDPRVQILASFLHEDVEYPYIVRRADFWYASKLPGLDTLYPVSETDAPTLVLADVLHDFFETGVQTAQRAIVRLEDVAVHIDPARLRETVRYLSGEQVPFVLGLIPAQRYPDGSIVSLGERPELVATLREAQEVDGTIALHGYHHTFGSGEDFEFWDPSRNAPLVGEAGDPHAFRDLYSFKVADGIRILRDQGIEPLLWETPHYAASPLAYGVFAGEFSHAIENRDPVTWLPYVAGPDEAGQILIPENIGYISPNAGWTVDAQLERANLLRLVRDAWAVGFYHPGSVSLEELRRLVEGLRGLGYEFADVQELPLEVRAAYRPDSLTRAGTMIGVDRLVIVGQFERWVSSLVPSWLAIPSGPWALVLALAVALLFLVRLPLQWRIDSAAESTLVEPAPSGRRVRRVSPTAMAVGISALLLMVVGWLEVGLPSTLAPAQHALEPAPAVSGHSANTPAIDRPLPPPAWTGTTAGWELSTYFTPVETFYSGALIEVVGCTELECEHGQELLGQFPSDFVRAVQEEGTGRFTSPSVRADATHLNWSINVGYWLDTAIRDARGAVLEPYVSVAADTSIPYVTGVTIVGCGHDAVDGEELLPAVCDQIRSAQGVVRDRFSQGQVGKHLDLYIGEQDQVDFISQSPRAIHVLDAVVRLTPYAGTGAP
jgi:hypothetical protein